MEKMSPDEAKSLFSHLVVIIDDRIGNDGTNGHPKDPINAIIASFSGAHIPVKTLNVVPEDNPESLSGVSFIIIDWDMFGSSGQDSKIVAQNEGRMTDFLRVLLKTVFAPIFVLSTNDFASATKKLSQGDEPIIDKNGKRNRVFVKDKMKVADLNTFYSDVADWMGQMPSAYVIKEWEKQTITAAERMFVELYKSSPDWAAIILDALMHDSGKKTVDEEIESSLGQFLIKNLDSRSIDYHFRTNFCGDKDTDNHDSLAKVMQGERFVEYEAECRDKKISQTGDLYLITKKSPYKYVLNNKKRHRKYIYGRPGEYLLNIKAQCDLQRSKKSPILYCVSGIGETSIAVAHENTIEGDSVILENGTSAKIQDLISLLNKDPTSRDPEFKELFNTDHTLPFFSNGEIVEKKNEVFIPCIANQKALHFLLREDIITIQKDELEKWATPVGRIMPPYITYIRQKWAMYAMREGTLPVPEGVFK